MTIKLQSNVYIGPVNIFPNFWHCIYELARSCVKRVSSPASPLPLNTDDDESQGVEVNEVIPAVIADSPLPAWQYDETTEDWHIHYSRSQPTTPREEISCLQLAALWARVTRGSSLVRVSIHPHNMLSSHLVPILRTCTIPSPCTHPHNMHHLLTMYPSSQHAPSPHHVPILTTCTISSPSSQHTPSPHPVPIFATYTIISPCTHPHNMHRLLTLYPSSHVVISPCTPSHILTLYPSSQHVVISPSTHPHNMHHLLTLYPSSQHAPSSHLARYSSSKHAPSSHLARYPSSKHAPSSHLVPILTHTMHHLLTLHPSSNIHHLLSLHPSSQHTPPLHPEPNPLTCTISSPWTHYHIMHHLFNFYPSLPHAPSPRPAPIFTIPYPSRGHHLLYTEKVLRGIPKFT